MSNERKLLLNGNSGLMEKVEVLELPFIGLGKPQEPEEHLILPHSPSAYGWHGEEAILTACCVPLYSMTKSDTVPSDIAAIVCHWVDMKSCHKGVGSITIFETRYYTFFSRCF